MLDAGRTIADDGEDQHTKDGEDGAAAGCGGAEPSKREENMVVSMTVDVAT